MPDRSEGGLPQGRVRQAEQLEASDIGSVEKTLLASLADRAIEQIA